MAVLLIELSKCLPDVPAHMQMLQSQFPSFCQEQARSLYNWDPACMKSRPVNAATFMFPIINQALQGVMQQCR